MQITYEKVIQLLKSKGIKYNSGSEDKIDLLLPVKKYKMGDKVVRIFTNREHAIFGKVYTVKEIDINGFIETYESANKHDSLRIIPYEWFKPIKSYQPAWL